MKHIWIVNPCAGTTNHLEELQNQLSRYQGQIDYEIHITQAPKEATSYIQSICRQHPEETYRFYACGGDGTLNEVMQGVIGFSNASITVYPCGSGNDFVKCVGGKELFLNLEALIKAEVKPIDVMKVNDRYAINVINFGFDTIVCDTMIKVKHKPIIGGKNAYNYGVLKAFFTGMKSDCHVEVDGVSLNEKEMMLCSVSNGQYVGGAFKCAPKSSYCDGLLDVCLVKPISRFRLLQLIGVYRAGKHLDDPKFQKILRYRRGTKIEVTSGKTDFAYCLDGEIVRSNHFVIEVLPNAVSFAIPQSNTLVGHATE